VCTGTRPLVCAKLLTFIEIVIEARKGSSWFGDVVQTAGPGNRETVHFSQNRRKLRNPIVCRFHRGTFCRTRSGQSSAPPLAALSARAAPLGIFCVPDALDVDPGAFTTAAGVSASVMSFRNATPGQQPLTVPGSTDAALAVKTERFPPYGLPPITARR
jgi:hypothetical protein